ncbi:MAG: hypothetical protein WCV91_05455 [Candidatus Margulisiibacteriota bacterium]
MFKKISLILAVAVCLVGQSYGGVPELISMQGKIESTGADLADNENFMFKFFDHPMSGTQVGRDIAVNAVKIVKDQGNPKKGIFNTNIPTAGYGVDFNKQLNVEIYFKGISLGRQQLSSVPYSYKTVNADSANSLAYNNIVVGASGVSVQVDNANHVALKGSAVAGNAGKYEITSANNSAAALIAITAGSGPAVSGTSASGNGVYGKGTYSSQAGALLGGVGVVGKGQWVGVYGEGQAVVGKSSGIGVYGSGDIGIYGKGSKYAAIFDGDIKVIGNVEAAQLINQPFVRKTGDSMLGRLSIRASDIAPQVQGSGMAFWAGADRANAIEGQSNSNVGVYGGSFLGTGVEGRGPIGVYGASTTDVGKAGSFFGGKGVEINSAFDKIVLSTPGYQGKSRIAADDRGIRIVSNASPGAQNWEREDPDKPAFIFGESILDKRFEFKILNSAVGGAWRDVMVIDEKAQVGIGTATPGAKLDVYGDGTEWRQGFLFLRNKNNLDAGIRLYNDATVKHHIFNAVSLGNKLRIVPEGAPFASGGITILQNGKVGVGTAEPNTDSKFMSYTIDRGGVAIWGESNGASAPVEDFWDIFGTARPIGVAGKSERGIGVLGSSPDGEGVRGFSDIGIAVSANTGSADKAAVTAKNRSTGPGLEVQSGWLKLKADYDNNAAAHTAIGAANANLRSNIVGTVRFANGSVTLRGLNGMGQLNIDVYNVNVSPNSIIFLTLQTPNFYGPDNHLLLTVKEDRHFQVSLLTKTIGIRLAEDVVVGYMIVNK